MLQRPKKKELSAEERKIITQASASQTGSMSSPKTYDQNYPLFQVPVNKKVLAYIPNHVETKEDGTVELIKDVYAAHDVRIGKAYQQIRCSGDIVNEALGLDGSCPVCNAMSDVWDLYNIQFAELATARGLDPKAPETKDVLKEEMKPLLDNRVIKKAERYYTFPIVIVECEEGKTIPKKDSVGKLTGTPCFYTIRETTYQDKWESAFDALDDGDDHNPAGRWVLLNFTYTPKSGSHNQRDSARNLKVSFKTLPAEYAEWEKYFDDLTKEWTPEKAQDVLVRNVLRDMDEMKAAADEIIAPVRQALAMHQVAKGVNAQTQQTVGSASEALAGFGATPVEGETPVGLPEAPTGEMPSIGVK